MNVKKNDDTMVVVKKKTRLVLRSLRLTPRESYDEVINRLVKFFVEKKKEGGDL